jgi:hypothetical protein
VAAFARNLTREQMKGLGFPRDWSKRIHTYTAPSETTFARFLRHLDNQALQRELLRWLDHLLGKRDPATKSRWTARSCSTVRAPLW